MLTGFELSYSAAKEWCADKGRAAVNRATQPAKSASWSFTSEPPGTLWLRVYQPYEISLKIEEMGPYRRGNEGRVIQSAVICHAAEDAALAGEIAAYLESNCALTVSLEEGDDLVGAVEIGLSADIVLAALSPASVPKPWKRETWEPVFLRQPGLLGSRLACLLLRECRFPELFRRGSFFDLSGDSLAGMRAL